MESAWWWEKGECFPGCFPARTASRSAGSRPPLPAAGGSSNMVAPVWSNQNGVPSGVSALHVCLAESLFLLTSASLPGKPPALTALVSAARPGGASGRSMAGLDCGSPKARGVLATGGRSVGESMVRARNCSEIVVWEVQLWRRTGLGERRARGEILLSLTGFLSSFFFGDLKNRFFN